MTEETLKVNDRLSVFLRTWAPNGRPQSVIAPSVTMENGLDLVNLRRDPAATRPWSTRLGVDFLRSWDWFARWPGGTLASPVLVLQGTDDHCVDPEATVSLAGRLKGDVTLKTWDGSYHVLHYEPQKAAVLAYIAGWMDKHVA